MARFGRAYPISPVVASPVTLPVNFLAAGAGHAATTATSSYSDTVPVGTSLSLIWCSVLSTTTPSSITGSATIGAASATQNTFSIVSTSTGDLYLGCFFVLNPPTGSQTVSFTASGSITGLAIDAVHYQNAVGVGAPSVLASQSGTTCSMSVSASNPFYMYGNAFGYYGNTAGQTFSGYGPNQRYTQATVSSGARPIVAGDAQGNGGTLTFSATRSNAGTWGGIVVPLIPRTY